MMFQFDLKEKDTIYTRYYISWWSMDYSIDDEFKSAEVLREKDGYLVDEIYCQNTIWM